MAKTKKQKTEEKVDEILEFDSDDLISAITADIKKDFELSDPMDTCNDFLSSGNLALDYILSGKKVGGGFPAGLITEISGHNSTGKTLVALHALVETQKRNGVCILIDVERSFNHEWFSKLGGDPNKVILYQPDTMEEVFHFLEEKVIPLREKFAKRGISDKYITVVWDSLAATSTKFEKDNPIEKADMGKRANVSGKGLRKTMGPLNRAQITFIVINQLRKTMAMFGPDEDTVGGLAMKYAASVRLMASKGKFIQDQDERKIGVSGRFKTIKSRLTAPFQEVTVDIFYNGGINPISGWYDVLETEKTIINPLNDKGEPSSGWYIFKDQTAEQKWRKKEFFNILKTRKDLVPDGFDWSKVPQYEVVDDDSGKDAGSTNVDADDE